MPCMFMPGSNLICVGLLPCVAGLPLSDEGLAVPRCGELAVRYADALPELVIAPALLLLVCCVAKVEGEGGVACWLGG